uniref:Uncharacterized protein n=1 Tax=Rhizophora mucronata TaxID=61149 RepID=A0A2P2R0Y2_RHIMU
MKNPPPDIFHSQINIHEMQELFITKTIQKI